MNKLKAFILGFTLLFGIITAGLSAQSVGDCSYDSCGCASVDGGGCTSLMRTCDYQGSEEGCLMYCCGF